ncbi:MAG: glycosyltransferase family 4 protein [Planctomycetes bacterium]|nr:glycosyltransferase family 4 protein [Planctomycetota bacterium]
MNKEQSEYTQQKDLPKDVRPVLIVSNDTVSEYGIALKHLLAGLADVSISSALICRPDCDIKAITMPRNLIIRHPVFDIPFMGWQNRRILLEKLKKFQPTLLHCISQSKALLTRNLAKQLAIPYVLSINSLQKKLTKISISTKRCAKIITSAEAVTLKVQQTYPRIADRIQKINMGTFTADSPNCFSDLSRMASIVTFAPAKNEPGFDKLLSAVKHLVVDGYEFMLVIISGQGSDKQLQDKLKTLGLLNIVINVPRRAPWRSVLAAGDIFVQPVISDSFNPMMLEAMSVGAVVAACKGDTNDLLIDGKTCAFFDPNDELDIYSQLKHLFDKHEHSKQLAQNAQQNLRKNHQVSTMVNETLQLYREVQDWLKR